MNHPWRNNNLPRKKCIQCNEKKPYKSFKTNSDCADGHYNKCKACCVVSAKASARVLNFYGGIA